MTGDLNWNNVQFLVGADNDTVGTSTFTDESTIARTPVPVKGTPKVDATQTVFSSSASIRVQSYQSIQAGGISSRYGLGGHNLDMTFECWIYLDGSYTGSNYIFDKRDTSLAEEFSTWVGNGNGSGKIAMATFSGGSQIQMMAGVTSVSLNTWHHVAFVRYFNGTNRTYYMFLDGNLENSMVQTSVPQSNSQNLNVGRSEFNSTRYFQGWIDEVRVTAGVARYTASFGAPTGIFPRGTMVSSGGGDVFRGFPIRNAIRTFPADGGRTFPTT